MRFHTFIFVWYFICQYVGTSISFFNPINAIRLQGTRLINVIRGPFGGRNRRVQTTATDDIEYSHSGLCNLGNTCYMNSVIQCLYHTKPIRESISESELSSTTEEHLRELFQLLGQGKQSNWYSFRDVLMSFVDEMDIDVRIQEDAEELLLKLVDKSGSTVRAAIELQTENFINCINVDYRKVRNQKCLDLSIALDSNSVKASNGNFRLEDLVRGHFTPEILRIPNQYNASIHGLQDVEKGTIISKLPSVLVFHLKRFAYDVQTNSMRKVS